MSYFIGIDGGGSKTECLLGDEQRTLGHTVEASCKIQAVGEADSRAALHQAVRAVCREARIEMRELTRVCVGVAGVSRPDIAAKVRGFVRQLTDAEAIIVGDHVIALEAATAGDPGMIVIAGTGSIAYGRNEQGEEARAGGLGMETSDEGSAAWIGRRALEAALHAGEAALAAGDAAPTGAASGHNRLVEELLGLRDPAPGQASPHGALPRLAGLFPRVVKACERGDTEARDILFSAATELVTMAESVLSRLWPDRGQAVAVSLAGGVFQHSALVRKSFTEKLQDVRLTAIVNEEVVEPVKGALALARKG